MLVLTYVVFEYCVTAHRALTKGDVRVMSGVELQFPKETDSMVINGTISVLLSESSDTLRNVCLWKICK